MHEQRSQKWQKNVHVTWVHLFDLTNEATWPKSLTFGAKISCHACLWIGGQPVSVVKSSCIQGSFPLPVKLLIFCLLSWSTGEVNLLQSFMAIRSYFEELSEDWAESLKFFISIWPYLTKTSCESLPVDLSFCKFAGTAITSYLKQVNYLPVYEQVKLKTCTF